VSAEPPTPTTAVVPPTTGSDDAPARREWNAGEDRVLRLWIALARWYATFSKAIAVKVQEYGLTTPQFGVLEALYHLGPLTLGDLADKLLVTGGNVTYVMDRLEDQGLVYHERSPEDRRVIQAKLTDAGRAKIADVFPGHAEYVETMASHLGEDEQWELRALLKTLGIAIQESVEHSSEHRGE
jgi:MarR family 2-MHQ and catechol resistance regulon transcriptional repressor